eukprot:scaffold4606_cov93-Phaeocystis_antarctica.AAC.3
MVDTVHLKSPAGWGAVGRQAAASVPNVSDTIQNCDGRCSAHDNTWTSSPCGLQGVVSHKYSECRAVENSVLGTYEG